MLNVTSYFIIYNVSINYTKEIEIRLNLKEAELEWNEFKKKIIDGIKDDNILGSANARLQDYNAYYKNDNTGIIQRNTEHINAIRNELLEMDRTGWSEVYGDNRAQALEDLQTYYQQMMEDLQEIEEIQEDIHDSYLDMIEATIKRILDINDISYFIRSVFTIILL